ncbi:RNA pyrophosphohydrolase [Thomasclavelia cocleata]|uniref:RNA pyrophosphohydrolase n=1 Tax=Thomasclavelia cocleata TaxID=69824 RepID=UPI00258AABAC|nr:RNA pyrophosphohydrolase [Thomasclavelia cocleata]
MSKNLPDNVFRANVGAILVNNNGYVMVFERLKIKNAWQFPQGGLNENEEPLDAIYREILEETGLTMETLTLISEFPEWLAYELDEKMRSSKHGRGQVQKWFLFEFKGNDNQIDIVNVEEQEFSAWKWMKISEVLEIVPSFRKSIYRKLANYWKDFFN